MSHASEGERCRLREDCTNDITEVVVTVNGWVIDCCHSCAVEECDHLQYHHADMGKLVQENI